MKKVKIQNLLLQLFLLLAIHSNSQNMFTKELKWNVADSATKQTFHDTNQIINWGKNFGAFVSVETKKISMKDCNVFILIADKCSGIYCPTIYVYQYKNEFWQLIMDANVRLSKPLEIYADEINNKIIFKTKSEVIGELPLKNISCKF